MESGPELEVVVEPETEPDVGEAEAVTPEETKPPVETGSAATSPVDEAAPGAERIGDLETEQVAMSDVIAEADEAAVPVPSTHQRRSFLAYWQDPEQRLRYYIRWVATAVVMLVLAVVLVWAVGELLDAVGQVTDQFGTQEVDEFESLRLTSAL
ncbi:MAG: hypothetical protein HKO87_05675 [Acidimicrobiia bacterium]|nr:hypothetical protein [Acidimicrobiia bacterium]